MPKVWNISIKHLLIRNDADGAIEFVSFYEVFPCVACKIVNYRNNLGTTLNSFDFDIETISLDDISNYEFCAKRGITYIEI